MITITNLDRWTVAHFIQRHLGVKEPNLYSVSDTVKDSNKHLQVFVEWLMNDDDDKCSITDKQLDDAETFLSCNLVKESEGEY